jgi:hypothetical protein
VWGDGDRRARDDQQYEHNIEQLGRVTVIRIYIR